MHPFSLQKPPCSTTSYIYTLYLIRKQNYYYTGSYIVLISSKHYHESFTDIAKNVQWESLITYMYWAC